MLEMAKYDFVKMEKKLSKYLDVERMRHTVGVMYTCGALAMAHSYDMDDAMCAGLLHDSAKCIPNKKKLKLCDQHQIPVTPFEREHPFMLHAKLGAYIAEYKYEIQDPLILDAITYHTTGRAGMAVLEQIVYIADYIEPGRFKAQNLTEARRLAFQDLDECCYMILRDTLDYLTSNPRDLDLTTKDAFLYYSEIHSKKQLRS